MQRERAHFNAILTVRITKAMQKWLEQKAKEERRSKSNLVQKILEDLKEREEKK